MRRLTSILLIIMMLGSVMSLAACSYSGSVGNAGAGGSSGNGITVTPGGSINGGMVDINGDFRYDWETTSLNIEISNVAYSASDYAGTMRYYAGEDPTSMTLLDGTIKDRNASAEEEVKVDAAYSYVMDHYSFGWGSNVSRIINETSAGGFTVPDIYVNFAYDLVCASLHGCFANLLNNKYFNEDESNYQHVQILPKSGAADGEYNYFLPSQYGGYYYDYMRSLSLSDDKLYCLASEYTLDVVRSMPVIPFNVKMFDAIQAYPMIVDSNGDGTVNIVDLYIYVYNGCWNYSAFAEFPRLSQAYDDSAEGLWLNSELPTAASAMIYSSSVSLYSNPENGLAYYTADADALENLFMVIGKFMTEYDGSIKSVTDADAAAIYNGMNAQSALRKMFSDDKLFFGGIVTLGELEEEEYQYVRANGGLGILPVPMVGANDGYRTVISNTAKLAAISAVSSEQEQSMAFLNTLSKDSEDVVEGYYLEYFSENAGESYYGINQQMLEFIEEGITGSLDMTMEDMVQEYMGHRDPYADQYYWYVTLAREGFELSDARIICDTTRGVKENAAIAVSNMWAMLE